VTAGGLVADVTHPHGTGWFWGRLDGAHLSATKVRQQEVLDASEHVRPPLLPAAVWLFRGLVLQRTAELVGHDVSFSTPRTPRDRQGDVDHAGTGLRQYADSASLLTATRPESRPLPRRARRRTRQPPTGLL
jgi:hypothetical protein